VDLIKQNILDIGSDEFYRASRYKVPLLVILVNTNDKNAFNVLDKCTRQTDIVQQLSSELLVVYLSHTGSKDADAFINKIKKELDFTYTFSEYINDEFEFIHKLLVENSQKI